MSLTEDPGSSAKAVDFNVRAQIKRSLAIERAAVEGLISRVGAEAEEAVRLLHECTGHVIVTGLGKAGAVARKLAATFSSTGTPSLYLHPVEALHGDLGVIQREDTVIVISNSGESPEIIELLPHIKRLGVKVIALTAGSQSTLAKESAVVLDVSVTSEADALGLAPTASTTAAMAMGDAIAAALMAVKGITREQYAAYHPSGSLGNLLAMRVEDIMIEGEQRPQVAQDVSVREAIFEMTSKRLGATFVVDGEGCLCGIMTDGDLRRLFQNTANPLDMAVKDAMISNPKWTTPDTLAVEALRLMENHNITVLPVLDEDNKPVSAIHLHDLVKAGLATWSSMND